MRAVDQIAAGDNMLRRITFLLSFSLFVAGAVAIAEKALAQSSDRAAGLAAYDRIASVLQGPRCLNCHPRGDRPHQGDDRHVHLMNVQRGADGYGMAVMRCAACHQQHNNDMAGVPGAPGWHLAPRSMAWEGLSKAELCRMLLDRQKNGGRSVDDLVTHMKTDHLVLWGFSPDAGRMLPPLSRDEFVSALEIWAKAGAPCPRGSRT
jgi:hypothetical protein